MQKNQHQAIGSKAFFGQDGVYAKKNIDPERQRKVYDNIHGFISFPQKIWNFIDTPEFQRLRNIKQLGTLFYVFPGAIHSRFQHSIGTGYLAQKYVQILIKNHKQLYQVRNKKGQIDSKLTQKNIQQAIFTVTLAGIMHDIGHGPYSHAFDGTVIAKKWKPCKQIVQPYEVVQKWEHQYASRKIFENLKVEIEPHLKKRVVDLIYGRSEESFNKEQRPWQFQLISNQLTGLDVDKLDYFRRDAYYLGAKNIYIDNDLLMQQSRILKSQKGYRIAFPSKYYDKVMDIYHSRYKLHQNYYLNKVCLGIQSMICSILQKMQDHPAFKLVEKCKRIVTHNDITGYVKLTDNIINKIDQIQPQDAENETVRQNIKDAKDLLNRIRVRDIYRFVKSSRNSFNHNIYQQKGLNQQIDQKNDKIKKIFNKDNIKKFIIQSARGKLKDEDIFILQGDTTFGMKTKNPLNEIKFFNKGQKTIIHDIKPQKFTLLETKAFIQKHIEVYLTVDDEIKFNLLKDIFTKYIQVSQLNQGVSKVSTPRPYTTRKPLQDPDLGQEQQGSLEIPNVDNKRQRDQQQNKASNNKGRKKRKLNKNT